MKKIFNFVVFVCLILFTCSCGHSILRIDRGTGIMARIPLPDGSDLINVKAGKIDSVTAVLKGNTSLDSVQATGGSVLGSAGLSDRIVVMTNPQLNEGYLKEVFLSPNVDNQTKLKLAEYLATGKAPKTSNAKATVIGAAVASGQKQLKADPKSVGVDNIVDKIAQTAPQVVPPVAQATKQTVKSVGNNVQKTITQVSQASTIWIGNIKHIILYIAIAVIIIVIIAFIIFLSYKKKKAKQEVSTQETPPENKSNQ